MPPKKKTAQTIAKSTKPAKRVRSGTPVASLRHKDKRKNIPTKELRDFVAEDESHPKVILYPRDPSLDPQLVWKGKDEQDREDLAVPVVPVYIQEKIHPQAIIDSLPRKEQPAENQVDFFGDFNGFEGDFQQKISFYQYDQHWSNRMILGDSLLVMTSLAEKEGLKGNVQTIYFDPPYGIKFGSNWQVSTRKRDVKDGKAEDATRQPEQVRAFRDTWQMGVHSYLSHLRDRLTSIRELLTESGSIFVQIGTENQHIVRSVLDEVFGSEHIIEIIAFRTKNMTLGGTFLEGVCDYLLWYAKDKERAKFRRVFRETEPAGDSHWNKYMLPAGDRHTMTREQLSDLSSLPEGASIYQLASMYPTGMNESGLFEFEFEGKQYRPPAGRSWKTNLEGMTKLAMANRLEPYESGKTIRYILKLNDYPVSPIHNMWQETPPPSDKTYAVQTSNKVVERCLLMTTDPGDLVLDPTCGSGTTAAVAEQWGRRWITIDTSRVALALARTRLMAAKFPYYLLADSPEGIKKESELSGQIPPTHKTENDIRRGFVYKRVPHVTLKSIANNPDIKEGMTRKEIDAAIARHAEQETLYDQPYEDKKTVRVSGPFTVESLSPHRVLSTADDDLNGTVSEQEAKRGQDFAAMIFDNLRKAGVQNTKKGERLTFDALNPYPGLWIHATGEYTDADGKTRRVAVSLGPEHGTVGPQQVKEAAKEAVQGVGYDLLLVCGFAFDPHVAEEAKRYGKLTVLAARMNPDLAMGSELLKKTGAGNLFMVFGEPDVDITTQKDGNIVATIKGVDVYDPTTGEIRSSSTDDIACWFIDTDYNGESFFVRHAYFTGADEPYEKLKRALRADIDESAWSALYSTTSRPFPKPASGKIAIKVINHYGDEVLKVFEV
jgi:adenine-specific DNA-methyltransferase